MTDRILIAESAKLTEAHCLFDMRPFAFDKRHEDGTLTRKPAPGKIIIEDDVEIGPGTVIECGVFRDTVIRKGTQIGSNCVISHDAHIGPWALICSGTVLGGVVTIGKGAFLGLGVTVAPNIEIGDETFVNMHSSVTRNVETWACVRGQPAHFYKWQAYAQEAKPTDGPVCIHCHEADGQCEVDA